MTVHVNRDPLIRMTVSVNRQLFIQMTFLHEKIVNMCRDVAVNGVRFGVGNKLAHGASSWVHGDWNLYHAESAWWECNFAYFNGTPPLLYCAPAHPNVSKYPNVEGEGWGKSEFLNPPHPLDPLVKRWPRQETRVTHWNAVAVGALHLMLATDTVSDRDTSAGVLLAWRSVLLWSLD